MLPRAPDLPDAGARLHSSAADLVARLPRLTGSIVLAISVVVLLGWALDLRLLQSFYPGFVTMKANAALGLGLSGAALLLGAPRGRMPSRRRWAVTGLAALVIGLGAATLAQYAFDVDLRIDRLLFPGRMAAVTALAFVFIGGALLTVDSRSAGRQRLAQWLALATGAFGLAAVLGYFYQAIPAVGLGQGIQIAAPSAVALVLLAVGLLARHAEVGWMPTLLSDRPGGVLARRLLPIAVAVPLGLGVLRHLGSWVGLFGVANGTATTAVLAMLAFGVMIWRTASALNAADAQWRDTERARLAVTVREASARAQADAERSAREAAERAVREKDETLALLDLVLENSPVGFAFLDRDLRYRRVNVALATMQGMRTDAYPGRTVRELVPELADSLLPQLRQVLTAGRPLLNLEQVLKAAAPGSERHFLASIYPIRERTGEIIGVGSAVVETTDRKRLEHQLHQAQKMEAVGQLAGGVAHDFNNLLTVITSYSGMLLMELPPDDATRPDLEEISRAADRAADLTRQLLVFSRQQVTEPQLLDLNAVTHDMDKMLRRLIRADVAFSTALAPALGDVFVDRGQIEQVIVNLVVNACDAMPHGGRLTIETANVELDARHAQLHGDVPPGEYVVLAVCDTGIGMSAETQARIFEPFFTTKEMGHGTGLGLATTYGIIQQSSGHIGVSSELGQGTTFRVYLPRASAAARSGGRGAASPGVQPGSETILLVEDDPQVRRAAWRVLKRSGYRLLEARTGAEALQVYTANQVDIDLLVTDIVMPELGGRELANALQTMHPGLAVLYMSGYMDDAVLRRQMLEPGTMFLQKPFTPELLTAKVREALECAVHA